MTDDGLEEVLLKSLEHAVRVIKEERLKVRELRQQLKEAQLRYAEHAEMIVALTPESKV